MKNIFYPEKREELQWYKEHIDIRQYLESSGYALDKSRNTRRYQAYFHEERGDKVYVLMDTRYPVPSYYVNQFDRKDKGTLVDFIMSREKKDLEEARLVLKAFSSSHPFPENPAPKVEKGIDEAAEQLRRHQVVMEKILREKSLKEDSYLRSRFLEEDTIRSKVFKGTVLLNQAPDGVFWAFPLWEVEGGKVVGMSLKNREEERMLGRRIGLWISHPTSNSRAAVEQAVLTEHPIDAMSFYQLHKKEMQQVNSVFLSTAGNPSQDQLKAVKEFVLLHKVAKVVLAHDNDKAGATYNKEYQEMILEWNKERKENPIEVKVVHPTFKDWNADIKAGKLLELRQLEQQNIAQPKHLEGLHPLKEELAKGLYEKNYSTLAKKVGELRESFVEKEVGGLKTLFSIREVALINNQQKLLQLLERGKEEQVVPAPEKAKQPQGKGSKSFIGEERVEEAAPTYDRPPAKRNPINLNASDQQLERAYFKTIRNLQLQIKDQPQFRVQYQRLELYKNYPHLNEEEVDVYLVLMHRKGGMQQQIELTKGKGKGLAGLEI